MAAKLLFILLVLAALQPISATASVVFFANDQIQSQKMVTGKKHTGKKHIGKKHTGKNAYVYKRMRKKGTRKEAHKVKSALGKNAHVQENTT